MQQQILFRANTKSASFNQQLDSSKDWFHRDALGYTTMFEADG